MPKDQGNKKEKRVRACYAPDHDAALQMAAVLKTQGIDAEVQGGVRDIYQVGGSVVGEEIMVLPDDLARAQEILGQMTGSDQTAAEPEKSAKKTALGLAAAAVLLVILLLIRGFLF